MKNKAKRKPIVENPQNLTVASLRQQGHKVKVRHLRVFQYDIPKDIVNKKLPKADQEAIQAILSNKPIRVESKYLQQNEDNPFYRHLLSYLRVRLSERGGKTEVAVTLKGKKETFVGTAVCSKRDNFNARLGVKIALQRALKNKKK